MPKGKLTPREKKELAYERDHRVIGSGESVRAWRQSKKVRSVTLSTARGAQRKLPSPSWSFRNRPMKPPDDDLPP
jgi:hypothetical protein